MEMVRLPEEGRSFRAFFEHETPRVPSFFANKIKAYLGSLWKWLANGASADDPRAHLKSESMLQPDVDVIHTT